ncbi:hypothetical protein EVAR_11963_1 [Eumeta japonica]|uniref:Uncharacterized protein n=1 Tax=Eumeta variegata TaxID=151549 RepID=A0A4C1U5V9_EUMVA|nr:hypothetical protein EVAR_11963_1 [Eumeta japonica]
MHIHSGAGRRRRGRPAGVDHLVVMRYGKRLSRDRRSNTFLAQHDGGQLWTRNKNGSEIRPLGILTKSTKYRMNVNLPADGVAHGQQHRDRRNGSRPYACSAHGADGLKARVDYSLLELKKLLKELANRGIVCS